MGESNFTFHTAAMLNMLIKSGVNVFVGRASVAFVDVLWMKISHDAD